MSYGYGSRFIAKHTGRTGVESKNIARQLVKQNIDFEVFDWETIGEGTRDMGKRSKGVKNKLRDMYGVSLNGNGGRGVGREIKRYSEMELVGVMNELMRINESRSPQAKMMDWNIQARNTFKPSNKAGVALWKRYPNRYDIVGIDDLIK